MINIVLADDHKVVRKGLKALLGTEPDFNIVGETENGPDTVSLVERLKPDILVLDLVMPGLSGIEVTRVLNARGFSTGIVILSMQSCDAYVQQAFKLGAKAYILKESPPEELVQAIRKVMSGDSYLCSALSENLLKESNQNENDNTGDPCLKLTPREKEIMILAVNGLASKDIAKKLNLSIRTVETHRTNFMQKLNLHNQAQLVQYSLKTGIIRPEPNIFN